MFCVSEYVLNYAHCGTLLISLIYFFCVELFLVHCFPFQWAVHNFQWWNACWEGGSDTDPDDHAWVKHNRPWDGVPDYRLCSSLLNSMEQRLAKPPSNHLAQKYCGFFTSNTITQAFSQTHTTKSLKQTLKQTLNQFLVMLILVVFAKPDFGCRTPVWNQFSVWLASFWFYWTSQKF